MSAPPPKAALIDGSRMSASCEEQTSGPCQVRHHHMTAGAHRFYPSPDRAILGHRCRSGNKLQNLNANLIAPRTDRTTIVLIADRTQSITYFGNTHLIKPPRLSRSWAGTLNF